MEFQLVFHNCRLLKLFIYFCKTVKIMRDVGKRRNDKNCLYPHNSKETMEHWLIKAMVFKILHDRGCNVKTEAVTGGGIVDVVDDDNLVAYEIETVINEEKVKKRVRQLWKMHDVFFIDCKKVPDNLVEAVEYLKRKIA